MPTSTIRLKLCSAATLLALLPTFCRAAEPAPAYTSNPDFIKTRLEAQTMAKQRGNVRFSIDAWRKANKIAGGACMECFAGMIHGANAVGEWKDAAKYATEMEAAAPTAAYRSTAEMYLGHAYMSQSGREKPKPALLEQAHVAFVKAEDDDKSNTIAFYLDGMALALENKNAEASAAFRSFVSRAPASEPLRVRAAHMAENPDMARQKMAPNFAVTTLSGKQFNLDNMGGRVVLIDFWATWCGPCNQELPHMQKLAAKYADAPFEIVSISWDRDEAKWKSFIDEHRMTWSQYRDSDHKLSEAFGVDSIPHYFTIDSDGVLTAENVGSGSMADSRIDKLVRRAREAVKPLNTAAIPTQPGQ